LIIQAPASRAATMRRHSFAELPAAPRPDLLPSLADVRASCARLSCRRLNLHLRRHHEHAGGLLPGPKTPSVAVAGQQHGVGFLRQGAVGWHATCAAYEQSNNTGEDMLSYHAGCRHQDQSPSHCHPPRGRLGPQLRRSSWACAGLVLQMNRAPRQIYSNKLPAHLNYQLSSVSSL
jgi:hypothetical protein